MGLTSRRGRATKVCSVRLARVTLILQCCGAGVNFMEKTVSIRNVNITFSIWDLGGQREFINMLPLVSSLCAGSQTVQLHFVFGSRARVRFAMVQELGSVSPTSFDRKLGSISPFDLLLLFLHLCHKLSHFCQFHGAVLLAVLLLRLDYFLFS